MADGKGISAAARGLWARLTVRSRAAAPLIRRVLREPLTHFLIAGLALFIAGHLYQQRTDRHRIVITAAHTAQLANDYALQFGAQPDAQTMDALIRRDVNDEILFRQGLALKLDADDQIVRRRVVQKMQFLMQDLSAPAEPTDAQLQTYYQAHAAHYAAPPRTTFSHIYFSADVGGDAAAKTRATAVLRTLSDQTTRAPDKGDAFPDLYDFAAYEPDQVDRLFGRTPFSDAVVTTPPGHWAGPFRSGYGWHLLYVDARQAAAQPPLGQVRDAVRADYLQAAQDAANQTAFDKLARDYTVVRQDRSAAP
jgi:peptidyl-prolyl cis-trans isomerase C